MRAAAGPAHAARGAGRLDTPLDGQLQQMQRLAAEAQELRAAPPVKRPQAQAGDCQAGPPGRQGQAVHRRPRRAGAQRRDGDELSTAGWSRRARRSAHPCEGQPEPHCALGGQSSVTKEASDGSIQHAWPGARPCVASGRGRATRRPWRRPLAAAAGGGGACLAGRDRQRQRRPPAAGRRPRHGLGTAARWCWPRPRQPRRDARRFCPAAYARRLGRRGRRQRWLEQCCVPRQLVLLEPAAGNAGRLRCRGARTQADWPVARRAAGRSGHAQHAAASGSVRSPAPVLRIEPCRPLAWRRGPCSLALANPRLSPRWTAGQLPMRCSGDPAPDWCHLNLATLDGAPCASAARPAARRLGPAFNGEGPRPPRVPERRWNNLEPHRPAPGRARRHFDRMTMKSSHRLRVHRPRRLRRRVAGATGGDGRCRRLRRSAGARRSHARW